MNLIYLYKIYWKKNIFTHKFNDLKFNKFDEIYDDYELLIDNIYTKINLIEKNNHVNFNYKLNYFENGYWYVLINIYKKKCNNVADIADISDIDDNLSYISVNDLMFEDKFEYDLKEWIIKLLNENKELSNENKKLLDENKKLLNENKKLLNENKKLLNKNKNKK